MAKNVVISTLGFANPPLPFGMDKWDFDAQAQWMLGFLQQKLEAVLPDKPDLIVFPECANRFAQCKAETREEYHARQAAYYRHVGDRFVRWLAEVAAQNRTNIAYSAVRSLPGTERRRNSTIYLDRSGNIAGIYDKNHLVLEEYTIGGMEYGQTADLIGLDFGKVASVICFDLNFDDLLYTYKPQKPDLIVFCSAYHGGLRQEQWAYTCRSYMVSAVLGQPSRILDPFGREVAASTNYRDHATAAVNLDYVLCHLDYNPLKLQALKRKYGPGVEISDPGFVGSVMITSRLEAVSAEEMVAEFEIEKLDDYFARVNRHRDEHLL